MNPLDKYLKRHKLTAGAFAKATGLDRVTVHRIAKGQRGVGARMMIELERATAGEIPATLWLARRRAA